VVGRPAPGDFIDGTKQQKTSKQVDNKTGMVNDIKGFSEQISLFVRRNLVYNVTEVWYTM
jgi:hypothetical protein